MMLATLFRVLLLTCALIAARPASALVGPNVRIDENSTASKWGGVVSISSDGGGVYSGALLDRYHVLTAAHVAAGAVLRPETLTINVNFGGELRQRISAARIFIPYQYWLSHRTISGDRRFAWSHDIAVIRLSRPVSGDVPTYPLLSRPPVLGTGITMVAYGGFSNGTTDALEAGSNAAVKRVGENQITRVFSAATDDAQNIRDEAFGFTLDSPSSLGATPLEAGYAGGDSGSPVFVNDGGVWRIVGVAGYNGTASDSPGSSIQFGAIGGGTLVSPYADWIEEQMVRPAPEPETYAFMLAALGAIGVAARRLRDRAP